MTSSVLEAAAPVKGEKRAGKYLTFGLGKEEYAIPVLQVREIMGVQEITAVPQTPSYVKGVINLRGKVIPVVDLRLKFEFEPQEYTQRTCIAVVQIERGAIRMPIGIVVDEVSEVLTFQAGDIEDTPDFGHGVTTPYILGMAKSKGKVKILLDINLVITSQDMSGMAEIIS